MELPNYIPTPQLSYELPTRRFNRHDRHHSQPCVLRANVEDPHHVTKRSAHRAATVVLQNTTRTAVRSTTRLVTGALTANAPPPQGRTRWMRLSHSQVTRAGDEESGATPQGWVKGLRFKNGAQCSGAEIAMLCPTGSEHMQRR